MKNEVIEEYGEQIGCRTEEDFKIKLERLRTVSAEVRLLDDQLNGAIEKALIGLDPELKIELEDPKLDSESYK